jgi:hypothetical protein
MGIDYAEKEREFLASLEEETGRTLEAWMSAISAQSLTERNDIIEWLRRQGFMFAKASWLERIHHNGGKPVYADTAAPQPARPSRLARASRPPEPEPQQPPLTADPAPSATHIPEEPPVAPPAEPVAQSPQADADPAPPELPAPTAPATMHDAADLDAVLAKAKAYRPLAQHVIAQIRGVRPGAVLMPSQSYVGVADPDEFARLGIGAKELRLHLALGEHSFDDVVRKGVPGGGLGKDEALSHMVVLTDARQVDRRLIDLVARAASNVNG